MPIEIEGIVSLDSVVKCRTKLARATDAWHNFAGELTALKSCASDGVHREACNVQA
jgi:hypothetical protein